MKISWLEKLAEDGTIRPEALDKIYESCSQFLHTHDGLDKEASSLSRALGGLMPMVIGMGVMGAVSGGASLLSGMIQDVQASNKTQTVRNTIVNNPDFSPKQKEKAEARFNEITKFAPSLGVNLPVMQRLVHSKMDTGLSDHDVQNLINIQTKITPNPLTYSALSEKTSSEKSAEERCGELLAETFYEFSKESSTSGTIAGHLLRTVAPLAAIGAGISGISLLKGKLDERKLHDRLSSTYQNIMSSSKDTIIAENPAKAKEAFSTLAHFAPHIAVEPNAAKAFMLKLISYNTGPMSSDLRDITEIEKNMRAGIRDPLEGIGSGMAAVGLPSVISKTWQETMSPYQKSVTEYVERRIR